MAYKMMIIGILIEDNLKNEDVYQEQLIVELPKHVDKADAIKHLKNATANATLTPLPDVKQSAQSVSDRCPNHMIYCNVKNGQMVCASCGQPSYVRER